MSNTSTPPSPLQHRDIRSASKPFKRDKDHDQKWQNGTRPSAGVKIDYSDTLIDPDNPMAEHLVGGSERQREKVRPVKPWRNSRWGQSKSNHTPKPATKAIYDAKFAYNGRVIRQVTAAQEATEHISSPLSESLMDLLPTHANNTVPPVSVARGDEDVLYSFDREASPREELGLGGLVERAERAWEREQTEKIVRGEYEVLDGEGEKVVLGKGGKRSPKQRAKAGEALVVAHTLEDDDGFELV